MKIVHFTSLANDKASGVANIVPLHIINQSKIEDVYWCNISENYIPPNGCTEIYKYLKNFDENTFSTLPPIFRHPDLVVFHEVYYYKFIRIGKILNHLKIPYIIVPHGCLTKTSREKKFLKKFLALNFIFNEFIEKASAIQYLTHGELETSKNKWNEKYIIIPNGCFIPNFKKAEFNDHVFTGVYIGRKSIYYKGLDLLLEACSNIKSHPKFHKLKIEIYGSDDNNSNIKLESLIKKYKLEETVKVYDAIYDKEKEQKLLDSDFFILTSRSEGHPVALIEALSYGLPCLVTEATNMGKEILNFNAGWVAQSNSKSIESALIALLNSEKQLFCKGAEARNLSTMYEWGKITKESIGKYKEIVKIN
ncbi:glycosyltransferase [Planococcus chinensis]|uniref:Glycosyltransferase n=1 Tax=Planococcus chinensis TaxID=272917 RepID=A0ABW4QEI9_9BACL